MPGVALHERAAALDRTARPAETATARAARWRAGWGAASGRFAERLGALGLDEAALAAALDLSTADPARPEWAAAAERAIAAVRPATVAEVRGLDWRASFARVVRPFGTVPPEAPAGFAERLEATLVDLAAPTLVAELGRARAAGTLVGADGRERFADFVAGLTRPAGLAALLAEYPVLARLLAVAAAFAAAAHTELLTRLAADRAAIVTELLGGVDPGPVAEVRAGLGDRHQRGRSVAEVVFADGRRVIYKPRDLGAHVRLAEVIDRLGLDLRTAAVVARAGYGWLEFIPRLPVADVSSADRFYRRLGALLAVLHAVHGTDAHCENVIACGDQPVLVDAEAVFHPDLSAGPRLSDPAADALRCSVSRTGLLPSFQVGEHGAADLSAVGGDVGRPAAHARADWDFPGTDRMTPARRAGTAAGGANRPALAGRDLDPGDHEPALRSGFLAGYDAILRDRTGFGALLSDCADLPVRVVARPTRGYATLLAESTTPAALRDATDRDRVLDVLWTESLADPLWWRLARHEALDLWAGDVPIFFGRPGSPDLWTSTGRRLPGVLPVTALGAARDKLAAMGPTDRGHQEWLIAATLATREPAGDHVPVPAPATPGGTDATPERLLGAARVIADDLLCRGHVGGVPARRNWLGLELVDERQWLVVPLGLGLGTGYLGVALFLAELGRVSGVDRYLATAHETVAAVPELVAALAERPDLVAAIGYGGHHGLGGVAYGLARIGVLLDDGVLRDLAATTVDLAARVPPGADVGWATGTAGCLAAMTAVHAELGLPAAARLADRCAATLTGTEPGDVAPREAAGVAVALAGREGVAGHAGRLLDVAVPVGPGWCGGAAGALVAAARLGRPTARLARELATCPPLRDHSLCHGELGILEALRIAGEPSRTGAVLAALDRTGPTCGTPRGVPTPALLTGLSGIGHQLLRLGFDEVPSVLLLEPGSRSR